MYVNSHKKNYFNISNNYEYDTENPISSKEKCNKYTIAWKHEILGKITFTLRIYENPQIDNGINIDIENNASKCKGLLIKNYKPNLMKLDYIKERKSTKLINRLKKRKHKFSQRELVHKNEMWLNVKK